MKIQLGLFLLLGVVSAANAGDWDVTTSLTLGTTYSDNIKLDDDDKESDVVIEVTPSISLHGEGGRIKADIDYAMQNAIFLDNSDASSVFHQLDANATAELAEKLFFMDVASAVGQVIIDSSGALPTNNLSNTGNRTDFYNYSLSPYLTPHFGAWADGLLRYTYGEVRYDRGASDATIKDIDADIASGRGFDQLSWSANYSFTDQQRASASDTRFENAEAQARFRVSRHFGLIGTAGYSDNEFDSSRPIVNGSYWAAGGYLQPSRYYSLEAQHGSGLTSATVGLNPTRRTSLRTTYRDREVGLNPGETWSGSFNHYTRRTSWSASYEEGTTTQQQITFVEGFTFIAIDPITGEPRANPQPGDQVVPIPLGPIRTLTDEVIESKRASGTFGMKTGKTGLRLSIFDDQSLYLTTLREETTRGISGSLNRRLGPSTNAIFTGSYQRITDPEITNDLVDILVYAGAELTRQISHKMKATLAYRYSQRDSEDDDRDYTENRIEAQLTVTF